ncbi:MAG: XrtA system polysaccharide chain length determinant [Pseudomonadota bacterium]
MDELLHQGMRYLRAMWLHRWMGLIGAAIIGVVGTVAVLSIPDRYAASARVYVDTDSILQPLMQGLAVQPNIDQQISMLSRTLISRPNVEKLVRMADLDLHVKTPKEKEALLDDVTKRLSIRSAGADNLYILSYQDAVPSVAQKVVQSLTTIFVEANLGGKRQDNSTAQQFIEEQIAEYQRRLVDIETKLKEFKIRNIDLQMGEGRGVADRIFGISEQLTQARMALSEAVNSRNALRAQLAEEKPTLIQTSRFESEAISVPEIDGRMLTLKANLDSLLQRFTDLHPDVVNIRKQIRELELQRQNEVAARKRAALANPASVSEANPIYQQLKISLGAAEANVAALQARVSQLSAQHAKALSSLKATPELEAEYAELTRDYNTTKNNYNELVSRRESAELSGKIEEVGGIADFRVIDPPRAGNKPVAPNRVILLLGVFAASLGMGAFITFAASQIRPVFFDVRTLREVVELPVLGVVSAVVNEATQAQRRLRHLRFLAALGVLILVYGAILVAVNFLSGRAI